jgi:hypothetical protein
MGARQVQNRREPNTKGFRPDLVLGMFVAVNEVIG